MSPADRKQYIYDLADHSSDDALIALHNKYIP